MQGLGFKGLLMRQILNEEALLPVMKKAQQHQKAAQVCIDFFQLINKFFQSFSAVLEKTIQQCDIGTINDNYYRIVSSVCIRLLKQNKDLTQNTKGSSKQLTKVCNVILEDFSKYIQVFQLNVRKYCQSEQILHQLSKKYFRSHKNMLLAIDAYKSSFTDVTLIYNMDEKIRRYQTCQNYYRGVQGQYNIIMEKLQVLNQRKCSIVKNGNQLREEFTKVVRMIGSKVIGEVKNFVSYYCSSNKSIITFLAEQKYNLQKMRIEPFFTNMKQSTKAEMFNLGVGGFEAVDKRFPLIFAYPELVKEEFIQSYNSQMVGYLKCVEESIERRKVENRKINQLFVQYFKSIEKVHIIGVKEILQNFQKIRLKLVESFGPKFSSFVKSIFNIFQLLSGIDEKLVKSIMPKLSNIQGYINEENKLLKLFNDELKSNIERFVGKNEMKKIRKEEFTEEVSAINVKIFYREITEKAQFFKILIQGFYNKMALNAQNMSRGYTTIIHNLNESTNQFFSLCCEYKSLYFGPQQFKKNFETYQNDVEILVQKNKILFDELPFNSLKGETMKISFDGESNKVEDFKKIRKPVPIQNLEEKENKGEQLLLNNKVSGEIKSEEQILNGNGKKRQNSVSKSNNVQSFDCNIKKISVKETTTSNQQRDIKYLQSKIQFKQNQQFIKSFSCALSSKIVLQGRVYITSERICFYSGFNTNTIFFGNTFIQFPKQDITKIEKRLNALFMDNSISITTVQGELFFTSFFSRNEAYDLICKTFGISMDDHVYQFDESEEKVPYMIVDTKQLDDIKDTQIQSRKNQIQQQLSKFPYIQSSKFQLNKEGYNAFQLFKIFYANNEISIKRRKYQNFLIYLKEIMNHKDLEIDEWNPPLEQIMNQSTIKSNAPLSTMRKIRMTVPVASSGIPFMPKVAKSQQVQTLFLISKHSWILEAEVSTSGAPYTDTFKLQLRTTASSDDLGNCRIGYAHFINFVKSTMMKSVIESKSQQESIRVAKLTTEQMSKYFMALEQSMPKKCQNSLEQLKEQLDNKNTQLESVSQERETLLKQLQDVKKVQQKYKKIIVGSCVVNIILLLLLLS